MPTDPWLASRGMFESQHDPYFVVLSIAIAAIASFTAFDLAGRYRSQEGLRGIGWLAGAAMAMGGGIWLMHFIGILALRLPIPIRYDLGLTALSLGLPIAMTAIGFHVLCRRPNKPLLFGLVGIMVGGSIIAMHYTGMAAMRLDAIVHHGSLYVVAASVIAIVAATAAMVLAFHLKGIRRQLIAAPLMGFAVASMHYIGMRGTHFDPVPPNPADSGGLYLDPLIVASGLGTVSLLLMGLAVVSAALDRRAARVILDHANSLLALNAELEEKVQKRTSDLEQALRYKETILVELQHRVRNNLQVVKSLLHMQSRQFQEPHVRQAFHDAQNRVQTIALVHDLLFDKDGLPSTIELGNYLRNLCRQLAEAYDAGARHIEVDVEAKDIFLPLEMAIPAGLMITELVSNAFKHAFPKGHGQILVVATTADNRLSFRVVDDGIGMPEAPGASPNGKGGRMGRSLIEAFARQLGGVIEYRGECGTEAVFTQLKAASSDLPQNRAAASFSLRG